MDILENAKNIINNIPEENSWLVEKYDNFNLVIDNLTATPTNLIMLDGRRFKIIPDNESID
jgi:hypothetical protein